MPFWHLQFFQKMNEKIQPNYYGTSSRIVFIQILEELKTPKRPKRQFEINWPLESMLYPKGQRPLNWQIPTVSSFSLCII